MGYPIYKLLRAVNRQYPNNGFINYVDVREDTYDNTEDQMIDEDLRDLINETIQEVYKDVAIDEVYSFPTVPGQNQYVLPEDCDLRDIQEVTRTYQGVRGPLPTPFGPDPDPGPDPEPVWDYNVIFKISPEEGVITAEEGAVIAETEVWYGVSPGFFVPETPIVIPNSGYTFYGWTLNGTDIVPIDDILNTPVEGDLTYTGIFGNEEDEEMRKLTSDLTLTDGTIPTLEEGFYYTGEHRVFVSGGTLPLFGGYSVFYYDAGTKTLTGPFASAVYDVALGVWEVSRDEMLATTVANNDRVPVNSAVYSALGTSSITVSMSTNLTDATANKIPFNVSESSGNGFTLDAQGRIVVGSGITKVLVSGQVSGIYPNSGNDDIDIEINVANNDVNGALFNERNSSEIFLTTFAPVLVEVEEGDLIYTRISMFSGDTIYGNGEGNLYKNWTHLTVTEVKDTATSSDDNPLGGNGGGSNDNPLAG